MAPAGGRKISHPADLAGRLWLILLRLTGVERSTLLSEMAPDAAAALARHFELIDSAVAAHGGLPAGESGEGDGVLAVFGSTAEAVAAALAVQRAFAAEAWPEGLTIRVRIGVYTGEVRGRDGRDDTGLAAVRLLSVCLAFCSVGGADELGAPHPDRHDRDDQGEQHDPGRHRKAREKPQASPIPVVPTMSWWAP